MPIALTYAIGDVHGRDDLLRALIAACVDDAAKIGATPRFIFLGDICDKGPRSRQAFEVVLDVLSEFDGSLMIKGNHDDLFERSAGRHEERMIVAWLTRGGVPTLESYRRGDLESAIRAVGTMYSDHVRLVAEAPLSFEDGGYLFAHAGMDPAKPPAEQGERDLMWAREPFMSHVGDLGRIVVHGHTVVGDLPVVTENRISIDTDAYKTGRLTAARLFGDDVTFFQTDGDASRVIEVDAVRLDRGMGTVLDAAYDRRMAA
ncbi:metallophosphoesterase [Rhizobium leguminosarum]|uniref:metallophosphoesterase n=1 Tax=Rhizobium leguminosarum TaxID=384 RepID=UPI002E0FC0F4|nr:metallophosphoesterase [Rhizobium leguminosarum]WSH78047.1 metallophosphoesterase [Rhizobium leguminosarum]